MKNFTFSLLIALCISWTGYAQLPDFTLNVTGTSQTCLGNGSLTITVTGTDPDATMDYAVYLLPNITTPLVITTSTSVTGLVAGEYMVVATQSLDGESNSESFNVTVGDDVIPLEYTLVNIDVRCGNDGVVTVNVTSGNPVSYEIMAGAVIVAPQASNTFSNLPIGLYQVRVYDDCGEAVVITTQLVQVGNTIIWSGNSLAQGELPSCNTAFTVNSFTLPNDHEVFTPVSAVYTIYPPGGGAPIVLEYDPVPLQDTGFTAEIPFYPGQEYSYDVVYTDACGNIYEVGDNVVNGNIGLDVETDMDSCEEGYFTLLPNLYVGPFTVTFTSAPAGFDPEVFNSGHPTFDIPEVQYGGEGDYVPIGDYTVQITDACGRTATEEFTIEAIELEPTITTQVETCEEFGSIIIEIPGRDIVAGELLEAPDNYPMTLPQDVMAYVNGSILSMANMPVGDYQFSLTDECGFVYLVDVEVAPVSELDPAVSQRGGCQDGEGSIRINNAAGSGLGFVTILDAPEAYPDALPHDVSFNIGGNSAFFMNSLPEGQYTFQVSNECGLFEEIEVDVIGYQYIENDLEMIPHCGSFDITVHHESTGDYIASYWLQRFNEAEGVWEHPLTGTNYTEGTQPMLSTGIYLDNNIIELSIASVGHFRILKMFYVYSNGASANFRCYDVIQEFDFDGGPIITDAYSFPCANGLIEVAVIAEGVAPLSYSITEMDGGPFLIENGTSNLFSGLEPATYNFRVTDVCGNIRNIEFDIEALDPIEILAEGFCEGEASSLSVAEFSFLNYEWYEEGNPGTILSTTGTLAFPAYNSATDAGTYVVSITSDNENSCVDQILEYEALPNGFPNAGGDIENSLCNDGTPADLEDYLATPHDAGGEWEDVSGTGALNEGVLTTLGLAEGSYEFIYTVTDDCGLTDAAMLTLEVKDIPEPPVADETEPVCEGETIQLSATGVAGASYQWEGPGNYTSDEQNPVIADAQVNDSGAYEVRVTVNGCQSEPALVLVVVNDAPNAGGDNSFEVCNDGNPIDLTTLLAAPHDEGGTWEDVSGTGALDGDMLEIDGLAEGIYEFRYSVEVPCGLTDDSMITLQLKDIPEPPTVEEVTPVCEGEDIQLNASLVADAIYQWNGPDDFSSSEQNPVITGAGTSATGVYTVTVTKNGCTSVGSEVPVTVNVIPQFTLAGSAVLCEGQSSMISVEAANFDEGSVQYEWYHDDVLLDGIVVADAQITEPGEYRVIVENNGCFGENAMTVALNDNPFIVEVDAGCVNFDYMIAVTNMDEIGEGTIVWAGPENFVAYEPSVNITGGATGEYIVTVTNAEGCPVSASVMVDNTECAIPRGISPNGDGDNDTFDLSNLDVREIKIFNRYGLEVYHAEGYIDEWHGQSDKGELPAATYYYMITLSAGKQVTGWVYLQREY